MFLQLKMKSQLFHCMWRRYAFLDIHKRASHINFWPLLYQQGSYAKNCNSRKLSHKSTIAGYHTHLHHTHLEVISTSWPESLKLNYVWLRDHCRCNSCYNHFTNQRNYNLLDIPSNIEPQNSVIDGDNFSVQWQDGHTSQYSVDWLWKNSHSQFINPQTTDPKLWNKENVNITRVDMPQYMNTDEGVYNIVKSLVEFGAGIVINVSATMEATEKVVQRIAHAQHTMFGGMWEIADSYTHHDTSYSHEALEAHNDNTYFTEAAGLQVFHCVEHTGSGGETLLVDGFRAATELKQINPESFHRLSTLPIESEFLEPGRHYFSIDPVLKLHPISKKLLQIRFNLYDRAPMRTLTTEQIPQFYEDIRLLAAKVKDPKGELWLKLHPGEVLLIDNWRLLHGRSSYTGFRRLNGCYVGRADFLSKAKVLGLI